MIEQHGHLDNFRQAAVAASHGHRGGPFMDSDVYKVIEAASYVLGTSPDKHLDQQIDRIIELIVAAQEDDGYIHTWTQINAPDERWSNLRDNHELFCAGHLIEAGVAHFEASRKERLLDVAVHLAHHTGHVFGEGTNQLRGYPGHPILEHALVRLSECTGNDRYTGLAHYFLKARGGHFFAREHRIPERQYEGDYWQDHEPFVHQDRIKGHAARAAYLALGATSYASATGDKDYLAASKRLWLDTVESKMYITGGIGSSAENEGFTEPYDLPNSTAWQESCAAAGLAMWSHRLCLAKKDGRYADVMERALYNVILAAMAHQGDQFFARNLLESEGQHHRQPWFDCACCPPNVMRVLSSIGHYAYAVSPENLYINLYIQGGADFQAGDNEGTVFVNTDYPWKGGAQIVFKVRKETQLGLRLRLPGWCRKFHLKVNGQTMRSPRVHRGYIEIDRAWQTGDWVELEMEMPVERMESHPEVSANRGRVALQRGPLVYCFEGCDQSIPVSSIQLPPTTSLNPEYRPNLLGGITILSGIGTFVPDSDWQDGKLYRAEYPPQPAPLVAVPYYCWGNRRTSEMRVWIPTAPGLS